METNYSENNHLVLVGKVTSEKRFSHETYGEKFYIFDMEVSRLSDTTDIIPVTASERILNDELLTIGNKLIIKGQEIEEIIPITHIDENGNHPALVGAVWLMNNEGKTIERLI